MIAYAMFTFGKSTIKDWKALLIAGFAAGLFGLNVHPILVILASALLGVSAPPADPEGHCYRSVEHAIPQLQRAGSQHDRGYRNLYAVSCILFNRDLFDLVALMAKISLFSFGGGFASIPLMSHEIVEVHAWMDNQTFMNGIILGQVTPGPVVITATYVGYLLYGIVGAMVATLGNLPAIFYCPGGSYALL